MTVPRSRVFVSSVIEGFAEYRQAVRKGIEQASGEGILVNEDFPSQASSSRNTCLDAIDSCDVFLLVLGAIGGWKTPSGRLVVEEEYDHARVRKLPVLVFLGDVPRDAEAERFARGLEIEKGDGTAMLCSVIAPVWHLFASDGTIWSKIRAQDGRCDCCAALPTQR